MKKILSLVLAALMVFSMVPAIFADDAVTTAAEEVSEYQAAIDFLKLLGIYKGDGTGDAADELVTRWQMALFTSRFITAQVDPAYWATEENDSGFTDVEDFEGASEEALGAISFASQKGIVNGVGDGLFDPETGVQYREAITMIVRSLGYTYKASGYPWSYINKAREIGLLDGITGIAYTEQINRDVVAQLLYNALFIEIDGTNVAESAFNVGQTVVLITASNKVTYGIEDKVLRTNYVRFQELGAQGEPAGAQYHVSYDKFNLANGALAADAAVGTPYFVYYVNGCADIIYAESLTTVYENRGTTAAVAYDTKGYLTIDGSKYQIVTSYNELNKAQSWNKDAAGTAQVKLYQAYGKVSAGVNSQYVVDTFKNVWVADSSADNGYRLYAQYSAVMDKYYRIGDDGKWQIMDLEDILVAAGSATAAFKQITSIANTKLAYADFIVSDASMDGNADRVTVKQYRLGQISYGKKKDTDNKEYPTFTLKTTDTAVSTNKFDITAVNNEFVKGYRWTGMAQSAVANGSYVIYYVDTANKEINILKVADTVKGYLRGYDAANDVVYLDADFTTYAVGYNNLAGSPLMTKKIGSTDNLLNNINIIQPMVNTYVTLILVDNKVVKVDAAGSTKDYVIIDSFVAFEEDGIVANAWTTVTDEYTQIKINELNGWTVGGFDYYLYFLSGLFAGGAYSDIIPVKADTLYQVVYTKDGVYNLTIPAEITNDTTLIINSYGYIVDAAGKYVATNAKDFWMIFVEDTKEVIWYNGQLKGNVSITGKMYKNADNDFVFVVSDASKIQGLANLSGKVTQYMMFNDKVSGINNNYLFLQTSAYEWAVLMQDVYTGVTSMVAIDSKLVPTGWDGKNYAQIGLVNGTIYAVVDGKLLATRGNEKTFADAAAFYGAAEKYGTKSFTGANVAAIKKAIAEIVVDDLFPNANWVGNKAVLVADYAKKVTVYSQTQDAYKFLTSTEATINAILGAAGKSFDVHYVYTKEGKAVAWVDAAGNYEAVEAENVSVTAYSQGTVANGVFTSTTAWDGNTCDAISYWKDETSEYFYSKITFNPERQLSFNSYEAYRAAVAGMTVDVVFADGTKAQYTPATAGNVPDGITVAIPPVYENLQGDASPYLIVNFAFNLQAHGFVKSYTVTIDKGPGAAVQLTVNTPNM